MLFIAEIRLTYILSSDGSKIGNESAYAAVTEDKVVAKERLPKEASIFTAELYAMNATLKWVEDKGREDGVYTIFSDSKSSIEALRETSHPLVRSKKIK